MYTMCIVPEGVTTYTVPFDTAAVEFVVVEFVVAAADRPAASNTATAAISRYFPCMTPRICRGLKEFVSPTW